MAIRRTDWKGLILAATQADAATDRIDRVEWAENASGLALDQWQQEVVTLGGADLTSAVRLALLCPRQSGKSTAVAALVAVEAVDVPGSEITVIAPTQRQSSRLFARVRSYLRKGGAAIRRETHTVIELGNGSTVECLPGDRPDFARSITSSTLIIDEAATIKEALIPAILPSVAARPRHRIVILSTPSGPQGFFYGVWTADDPTWRRINVTAAEVPRYSKNLLEQMRQRLGDTLYSQEFEGQFIAGVNAYFSPTDLAAAFEPHAGEDAPRDSWIQSPTEEETSWIT